MTDDKKTPEEDPNRYRKPKDIDTERLTQEDKDYGWVEPHED